MNKDIKILLIDDNLHNRQVLVDALQPEVIKFSIFQPNSHEKLRSLFKQQFDLVISEISFYNFDEIQILSLIKEKLQDTPIIFFTANGSEEIAVRIIKHGATDYIVKSEKNLKKIPSIIKKILQDSKEEQPFITNKDILPKNQEPFRLLFEDNLDGVVLTKWDGTIFKVNAAACNIFGLSEEEFKKVGLKSVIDLTEKQYETTLHKFLITGSFQGELIGIKENGVRFPIDVTGSLFQDNELNLRSNIIIRDISDRKRAEEKIRESEFRLKEAQELAHLGFWYWEIKTGDVEWSDEVFKIFGLDSGTFKPQIDSILNLSPWPGDHERNQELINRAVADRNPGSYEQRFLRPDQSIGYYYSTFQGNYDDNGELISIIGSVLDITERRKAEIAFQQSHDMVIKLTEQVPGFVYQYRLFPDGRSCFPFVSSGIFNVIEVCHDEVKEDATVFLNRIHPDDTQYVIDSILKSASSQQLFHCEFRVILPKKGQRWLLSDSKPELLDDNSTLWYGIITDITDRKIAEAELREKEVQYRNLANSGLALIWTSGTDKLCNFFNQPWLKFTGRTLEQELGNGWAEGVHPDDFDACLKTYVAAFDKQETFDMEYRLRHVSGEYRWIRDMGSPNYNGNGEFIGYIGHCFDITERKKTEIALHETEEIFKSFMEHSPIYIFFKDKNIRAIRLSKNFETMLGKPLEELLGKNMNDLFPSELAKSMINDDKHILREGKVITAAEEFNGRSYTTVKFPIHIDGKARYLAGYTIDITEQKLSEEALRESEEKFRLIVENSYDIIYTLSSEGIFTFVSNAWTVLLGHPLTDVVGQSFQQFIHPDDLPACMHFLNSVIDLGLRQEGVEYRVRHMNGEWRWHTSDAVPIKDKKDKIIGFYGIARDITGNKKAKEALFESMERYKTLTDVSPVGIFHTDADGLTTFVNPKWCQLSGLSYEQALGNGWLRAVHPEDRKKIAKGWRQASGKHKPSDSEYRFLHPDGSVTWVMGSAKPELNFQNEIVGYIGTITDITERKMDELLLQEKSKEIEVQNEEYQQLNEELLQLNNDLYVAKEKAEESDRLKSAFLGNISHEIRTPMNSIVGFSKFINDLDLTTEERQQYSDIIIQSSYQLLSILTDIVNISTIETGQEIIIEKEINLNSTLKFLNEQFSLKASEKNICINLKPSLPDDEDWIISDKTKLIQILNNLIGNALKFTQQGYINVGYTIKGDLIEFFVEDTGIGIPPNMYQIVFERFRQVERAAVSHSGSGLGLSISKGYVELLGGKIWLTSELGKGSTFYFSIPYKKADTAPLTD
jgi:PAS domain S-box-containing protein